MWLVRILSVPKIHEMLKIEKKIKYHFVLYGIYTVFKNN